MPTVRHIFISPGHNYFGRHGLAAGENDVVPVDAVECLAGRGLRGDRFLDHKPDYKGQVTLFSLEVFRALLAENDFSARPPSAVRRNLITEGVDLNALVGREFLVGPVRLLGVEECRPCAWMDDAVGQGAETWLKGRGGLRCKILTDGHIGVGDEIVVTADTPPTDELETRNSERGTSGEPSDSAVTTISVTSDATAVPHSAFRVRSFLAGLVLAGGRSTRMGTDKALIEKDGEAMVARQARLLREAGCARVLVSGRPGVAYPIPDDMTVVLDRYGEGPAAGILAGFDAAPEASRLLVLATDMPDMSRPVLAQLLNLAEPRCGVAYATVTGVEPLAAVYPEDFAPLLRRRVRAGDFGMRDAIREAEQRGLMRVLPAPPAAVSALFNRNSPEDRPPAPTG